MTVIEPVPGDPSTEPVATAEQSHVDGRVGPPTFAQDATNEAYAPEGIDQIEPGEVRPADTAPVSGPVGELVPETASPPGEPGGDVKATAKPSPSKRS